MPWTEGGDHAVHGLLPLLQREQVRARERTWKHRRARVFHHPRDEQVGDVTQRMNFRAEPEGGRVLGFRQLRGLLGEFRIGQQRGMACAADLSATPVIEAEELWPGPEPANPVEGIDSEQFLEVALDVIPPLVYELEDSSDFPGACSAASPNMCRLRSRVKACHSTIGRSR